jgi:hypothetical protein
MPQYLVANYLPDDFDPSSVTEAMDEISFSGGRSSFRSTTGFFGGDSALN